MKILFASANYGGRIVGGAQLSIQLVAEQLIAEGHEVGVLFVDPNGAAYEVAENGVHLFRVHPNNIHWHLDSRKTKLRRAAWHIIDRFGGAMRNDCRSVIEKFRPDVLHSNVLGGLSTAVWLAARDRGVPIVHTVHDYYLICANSGMRSSRGNCDRQCRACRVISSKNRLESRYVDAVVYVSKHMQRAHEAAGLFREGVVVEEIIGSFRRASPPRRPERSGTLRIGFLGRVAPDKGVDRLIREINRVNSVSATLVVGGLGDPDYIRRLQSLASPGRAEFLGRVSPDEFFDSIDVLVVPSLWNEPAARVVYEAGLSSVPVVVSKRGGLPQLVSDGLRGWLYEPDVEGDLASTIDELANDWDHALLKADRWKQIEHEFSPEFITAKTLAVYQRVIAEVGTPT